VIFEITETAAVENLEAAREFVEELTALGFGVALDDFGTGYGSFTYLKHLPVTELKIDIDFVRGLTQDPTDQRLVKSIISVAQNFDMKTVAEGVEDQASLDLLRTLGVDFVQGYYIGYPAEMPLSSQRPAYSISPSRSALATADARSETSYLA
jgi:EAL domain-containing protein (putative c-di-GMP-specific phosphodiesterase class I)